MNYLNPLYHFIILFYAMHLSLHCQVCVFSDWSIQVYHYFCRLVYKIYFSGYGGVSLTVDYSLSVSTLVVHQTGHLHHLCCTCHHLTSPPHEGGDSGGDGGHTGGDGGEVTGAVVRGPVRPRPSDCTGHLAVKSRPRHQQSIHHQPQQHRHRAGAPHTAEPHPAAA